MVVVGQENQDYQSYDTGQRNQANPLRVTLSLGVVHTAPDEHRHAHKNENWPDGSRVRSLGQ